MNQSDIRKEVTDYKRVVSEAIIALPHVRDAFEAIEECIEDAKHGCDNRGLVILGESGTGKTHVLKKILSGYPEIRTDTGVKKIIVYVRTGSKPTTKGLAEIILHAMGDPRSDKGSVTTKTNRIRKLIKDLGVMLIIVDEFQHFVDKSSAKVQMEVVDWLKVLIEDTGVGLVVAGVPYAEAAIKINDQQTRRFKSPNIMPQYNWNNTSDRSEFRGVLKAFEKTLPGFCFPDLSSTEMAFRFYCASSGLIGRVANIFKEVISVVLKDGRRKQVCLADLEKAAKRANFSLPEGFEHVFSKTFNVIPSEEVIDEIMQAGITKLDIDE